VKITTFEDIEAWQLGRELTRKIYEITKTGEFSKDYGLKDQIRRASGSVMHNIAEGFDAGSNPEFIRFLGYSQRSCSEIQSQLYVALDQNYFDNNTFNDLYELANHAKSKVGAFIKYLKQNLR
jgi:four helix bundle protein